MKKSTVVISFTLCLLFSTYPAKKSFAQEIWTNGAGTTNWLDDPNWASGSVPPSESNVIIGSTPYSPAAFPVITAGQNILAGEMTIGNDTVGAIDIDGGALSGGAGYIGRLGGSTGSVTLDGVTSLFETANELYIGYSGNADFLIQGGATVDSNSFGYLGYDVGSTANMSITGVGSNLDTADSLYIGRAGSGTITVGTSSRIATGGNAFLGELAGGSGNITLDGSNALWSIGGNLFVGQSGNGNLLISNQARVVSGGFAYIGNQAGSNGLITVSGANTLWGAPGTLVVGVAGTGALTLTEGATVSGNNVRVADQAGSTGTINIGADSASAAAAPGFLNANTLLMGPGSAEIFFNHTDTEYAFTSAITGNGLVTIHEGGTIFNRESTYSGQTVIEGGTLFVENTTGSATGSSTVLVESGGILRGNGNIAGSVTVDGTIEPGSHNFGVLTVGSLTLNSGSNTRFRLTDPTVGSDLVLNDRIDVTGNLTLGGTLNTTISAAGVYRLFNYGGVLSGAFAGENHTSGREGFIITNSVVDTSTAGQVNLGVTADGQLLQFWDGANTSPSGQPQGAGGPGTWSSTNTNWTDNTGSSNGTWAQSVGVFAGASGGTVSIEGTQNFDTLQFITDGYVLEPTAPGNGALSINAPLGGTFNIESGLTATINAPIVDGTGINGGTEVLVINGGTIVLNGTNTYSGGTTVEGSTIVVGDDSNLGASTGGITLIGGTIRLASSFNIDPGRTISVLDAGGIIDTNNFNTTLSQAIGGNGDIFIKSGTGTLTLAGDNTYIGETSIRGGTLALSGTGQIQSSEFIDVESAGTFDISATSSPATIRSLSGQGSVLLGSSTLVIEEASHRFSGNIAGTGNLELTGGILFLDGINSYTGETNISGGAILAMDGSGQIAASELVNVGVGSELDISTTTSGTSIINLNGEGSVDLGGQNLTLSAASGTFSGSIRGAGALLINNTGTFTLSGSNIYSGGTTISGNTLIATNDNALGTGTVTNNANLELNFATDGTLDMQITGTGDLTKSGAGKASLTNANSSLTGGDVTVNGGTLSFEQSGVFNAGTYTTASAASTDIRGSAQLNITGVFTQSTGSELHVDLGGTNPSVTAQSATIADSSLFIEGFTATPPARASDLAAAQYTVISTTGGITGLFSEVDFGGAESNFDYLTLAGDVVGTNYTVGLGLTWLAGTTNGDGIFTVSPGTFEVDVPLLNQGSSATGWDGTTLTKGGAGMLILNAANAYTGQTTVLQGILRLDQNGALGNTAGLVIANRGITDLNGTSQTIGKLETQAGGRLLFNGGNLTISDSLRTPGDTAGGTIQANTLFGSGNLFIDPSIVEVYGANPGYTGNVTLSDGSELIMNNAAGVGNTGVITLTGATDRLAFDNLLSTPATGTLQKGLVGTGVVETLNGADITLAGSNAGFSGRFDIGAATTLRTSEAAQLGSATVANSGTLVMTTATNQTLSNTMTGTGQLDKEGAAQLLVNTALANFNGTTHINQGALIVGNTATPAATVPGNVETEPTATLSGTGTITGNVTNQGTIAALNAVTGYEAAGPTNLTIGNLSHTGMIQLAGTTVGNRLTVRGNMTGNGGSVHINTVLDGDSSPTDRLVIDGGTVSGSSNLIVTNRGGQGAQTTQGILVVDTINGATTNTNAFVLSPASSGYRAGEGSLAIGAYDYSLIRGGNGGQAESWYLTSLFDSSQVPNIRPEAGAYLANRDAAESMFNHAMRDRLDGYRTTFDPVTGQKIERAGWARVYGNKKTIYFASESLRSKVDTVAIQAGLDLLKWSTPSQGQFRTGIFVGKGDASGDTVLRHDGSYPASNDVDGYAVGLYGTWFQHEDLLGGFYVDSWVQRGWFDNTVTGNGLPREEYNSRVWSASLEGGYSFPLPSTGKSGWAFDPFAQIIYTHYKADEHQESGGTLVRSGNRDQIASRIAGRLHNEFRTAQGHIMGGFFEASLWHNSHTNRLFMNDDTVSSSSPKNIGELKVGLKNAAGKNMLFSFDVSAQYGSQSYRQFAGQVGFRYNW